MIKRMKRRKRRKEVQQLVHLKRLPVTAVTALIWIVTGVPSVWHACVTRTWEHLRVVTTASAWNASRNGPRCFSHISSTPLRSLIIILHVTIVALVTKGSLSDRFCRKILQYSISYYCNFLTIQICFNEQQFLNIIWLICLWISTLPLSVQFKHGFRGETFKLNTTVKWY